MTNKISIEKNARDFHVDIYVKETKVRVVAELPGVNEENIILNLNKDTLSISAHGADRNYYKQVELPHACKGIVGKISNNGILEVILN